MVLDQAFDCGADRRHRRCASGVAHVIRPVEVEDVGDASGNAVGQLARHGVFGDFGKVLAHALVQLAL